MSPRLWLVLGLAVVGAALLWIIRRIAMTLEDEGDGTEDLPRHGPPCGPPGGKAS